MGAPLRHLAAGVALTDLARKVKEVGADNDGPRVREMLRNAGINVRAPWCAAAVQLWADEAAQMHGLRNPLDEVKHEALVASYVEWAERKNLIVPVCEVDMGDIACFSFNTGNHMGLVHTRPEGDGTFTCIEGNTSPTDAGSQRDGDVVAVKTRDVDNYPVTFIRWDDGVEYEKKEAA